MTQNVVRVTDEERKICEVTIANLKGSSQKARPALILLQADVAGLGWTDRQVATAYRRRTQSVENSWRRCLLEGRP